LNDPRISGAYALYIAPRILQRKDAFQWLVTQDELYVSYRTPSSEAAEPLSAFNGTAITRYASSIHTV
jgi:hypothetical protein